MKFSFENYRGAKADVLKTKTERVEIVDARTVRFHFKEPFLDFPMIFGTSNVSGAGWIVPAKYYQQVGPDGFKQKPIGAGPYKLVHQEPGTRLEFEAFEDYYRPVHVKQLVMIALPEGTTRVAMLERGEADLIYLAPGELIERLQKNPKLMLAPVLSGSWWLEFPGFQNPQNPFHDKRVRQAVSLAVDRQAINEAEMGGFGKISGNWINNDVQYAMSGQRSSAISSARDSLCAKRGIRTASLWTGSRLYQLTTRVGRVSSRNWGRLAFASNSRSWSGGCSCRSCKGG